MEKAVATRMMEATLGLGNEINKLNAIINQLDAGKEKDELVQALGSIMSVVTRDFVFRITREHPELDPDR